MSKRLGYIRVSTVLQNTARQLDGIELDKTFVDKISGKSTARPQLHAMLDYAREGDVIYVHSMDRLARNLDDLRKLVTDITKNGITILFVKEGLTFTDKEDSFSKLMLSVIGSFAEFERSHLLERQREGIAIAKAQGKFKGRRPKFNATQVREINEMIDSGLPISEVARNFDVCRHTVYKIIRNDYTCANPGTH